MDAAAVALSSPRDLDDTRRECLSALSRLPDRRPLLEHALEALHRLPDYNLPLPIVRGFCREFSFIASASAEDFSSYRPGTARHTELHRLVRLQRFPAGQFDWEVGGISRSDLVRIHPLRLPGALWFVATRMRALRPVFFSHLSRRRPSRSLSEEEALRSYHRMAEAMARQPQILGFAACSWFRSPATHEVSPHLAWLSRVFEENGGLVIDCGYDDPHGGALARSQTRRRLFEAGAYRPRRGLALWPRREMLAWASRHPELGDSVE